MKHISLAFAAAPVSSTFALADTPVTPAEAEKDQSCLAPSLSIHWIGNAGKLDQQLSLASQAAYEGSIPFARSSPTSLSKVGASAIFGRRLSRRSEKCVQPLYKSCVH